MFLEERWNKLCYKLHANTPVVFFACRLDFTRLLSFFFIKSIQNLAILKTLTMLFNFFLICRLSLIKHFYKKTFVLRRYVNIKYEAREANGSVFITIDYFSICFPFFISCSSSNFVDATQKRSGQRDVMS